MALAVGAAYMAPVDVVYFAELLFQYAGPGSGGEQQAAHQDRVHHRAW
jgi:hypothetical protein